LTNNEIETDIKAKVRTEKAEGRENILLPSSIPTVHADKVTIAVDHSSETVTMSLLTMHPIPKISEKISIDNYAYELTGEVKIPFSEIDILSIYYLTTRTNNPDKLLNLIQDHFSKFPEDKKENNGLIRFGPTGIEPTSKEM
jgi:hypothetical protein